MLITILGISLIFAVLLAFVGDWRYAPEINIAGSAATFAPGSRLPCRYICMGR